ncbi:MAG: hypothetical protein L3K17_06255 [Thermoplasmata archaeon]|nr:hypothetical protein [Thermoplasmata archaeon]
MFWLVVIGALLLVELAELTDLFRLPLQSAVGNLLSFIFALVFTNILALVGAIFIGIYISTRLRAPTGFTPFEEEMLRMRQELTELRGKVDAIHGATVTPAPSAPGTTEPEPPSKGTPP